MKANTPSLPPAVVRDMLAVCEYILDSEAEDYAQCLQEYGQYAPAVTKHVYRAADRIIKRLTAASK